MDLGLELWQWWLILAALMFVVEIFSNTFVFLCICLSCLVAALTAAFVDNMVVQIAVFAVAAIFSFFIVRPLMNKYAFRHSDNKKLNADALVGLQARVSETIDEATGAGRVTVYGDDWKAVSEDGSTIEKNAKVEVVAIDSTILTVKKINF